MSDQIDYQIKGLDKLNKKLKRLQGKEIKDALHKTTDKADKYVHSQVQNIQLRLQLLLIAELARWVVR
jgi:hypothetical protein